MQAYCMKCRKKREMSNPKSITIKNKSWRHFGDKLKRTGCHQKTL